MRPIIALAALAAVLLAGGCARRPAVPVTPPPGPAPPPRPVTARAGYDGHSGYRSDVEASALSGRVIVLDPGHGGHWPGAVGAAGTREADVNLRVALELASLLSRAGARVHLTRDRDTSLVPYPDSTLAADLRARAALADSLDADVFVSLHHNADPEARRDVNETQVYYRTGDEGPSLDLAQTIHRRLVRGLALGVDRLLPGNYAVLRSTRATSAILGEPAYITFPPAEQKLLEPEAVRLEAESYFMGLLDYFRGGVPVVSSLGWEARWVGPDAYRPIVAGVQGVPEGVLLAVDGAPVSETRVTREFSPGAGAWTVRYAPAEPWRDGGHAVRLQVRNPHGNHSRAGLDTLWADIPAERLVIEAQPESLPAGLVALTARALDAWGRPIADTLVATDVEWTLERLPAPGRPSPAASARAAKSAASPARLLIEGLEPASGEARAYLDPLGARSGVRVRAAWRGLRAAVDLRPSKRPRAWATGFVTRTDNGRGVAGARVTEIPLGSSVVTNPTGFYALWAPRLAAGATHLSASAPGFADPGFPPDSALRLAPVAGGALLGRRIALDPEGGGDESGGKGPSGSRGSLVNLAVTRLLRELLEQAGAQVLLTRESEASTPPLARVQAAERGRAERLVRVGRRAGAPSAVGYYPGSTGGRALAERVFRRLWAAEQADTLPAPGGDTAAARGRRAPVLLDDANYVLQQTSCPAVSARLGDLSRPDDEARFLDPAWRYREAYLIYAALAEDLGANADSLVSITIRLAAGDDPLPGTVLWLDGVPLLSDDEGQARFVLLDPRVRHRCEVSWGGARGTREAWIDPTQGLTWIWDAAGDAPRPVKPGR